MYATPDAPTSRPHDPRVSRERRPEAREAARRPRRPDAGFGLVEVLVALVLISVGLLSIASVTLSSSRRLKEATWETQQTQVAQQVMDRLRQEGYDAAVSGSERVTASTVEYDVQRTVSRLGPGVKEVVLTVGASEPPVPARTFRTRLRRLQPLPAPP